MKKIIALCGSGKKGKTPTLYELVEIFKSMNIEPDNGGGKGEKCDNSKADKKFYFSQYKGKKIAITTGGDTKYIIKENLSFAVMYKCDVLITASRKRNTSHAKEELKRFAEEKKIETIWVDKIIEKEQIKQEAVNKKQARDLLNRLDEVIKELNPNP